MLSPLAWNPFQMHAPVAAAEAVVTIYLKKRDREKQNKEQK